MAIISLVFSVVGLLYFGLSIILSATNYITGTIKFDPCANANFVIWSNVPSAVVVEQSWDLTNWEPGIVVSQIASGTNTIGVFSFRIGPTNERVMFYRLREIRPFLTAPP